MIVWSAFAVVTLLVGGAAGLFAIVVWLNHDGPGATALAVQFGAHSVWVMSYGGNLLLVDPELSRLLEIPFWIAGEVFTIAFFFFALSFTGRRRYLTLRNAVVVSLIPVVTAILAVTNSLGVHQLFWSNYRVVEILGAGVRVFDPAPWLYVKSTYVTILFGAGLLMFIEEVLIERTLYRSQSVAIVAGTIVPVSAYGVWVLGIGPYPRVDFSPLSMCVALGLYGYAISGANLFETAPAVRRLGRENTIDDLTQAIVIANDEGVVIDLNESATDLLDCSRAAALERPLNTLLDGDRLDFEESTQVLSVQTAAGSRMFRAIINPTMGDDGRLIGQTILFYDITKERRREQRLEVLNRIVRHNLRNDLNAVLGFSGQIKQRASDEQVVEWADRITGKANDLVELGEKARAFETAIKGEVAREPVALSTVVEEVVRTHRDTYEAAVIESDVPRAVVADAEPELLRLALSNLVENAVEHHTGEEPQVTVRVEAPADNDTVVLRVIDDGPGIPEMELATLREGTEEALRHGQGIGLWVVTWCVRALGGTVRFDADADGTTVAIELQTAASQQQTETRAAA